MNGDDIHQCDCCSEESTVYECECDCGRPLMVCKVCLAEDAILACGECGIEEARRDGDDTLVQARRLAKLELELHDAKEQLTATELSVDRLCRRVAEIQRELDRYREDN